jgi:hypothetical protein
MRKFMRRIMTVKDVSKLGTNLLLLSSFPPLPPLPQNCQRTSLLLNSCLSLNYDYNGLSGTSVKLLRISRRSYDAMGWKYTKVSKKEIQIECNRRLKRIFFVESNSFFFFVHIILLSPIHHFLYEYIRKCYTICT